jgi:hypothetical protein
MQRTWQSVSKTTVALLGIIVIAAGGCDSLLTDIADIADTPGIAPDSEVARPADQFVTIAFRNLATTDAVDVEFYTTMTRPENLPDGLFIEENAVTASLGVAGTGLLVPGSTDVLEIPCNDNLIVGTAGGEFLDNETGETTGRGEPRWLEATSTGLCGAIVGFTFDISGDTFITTVELRQ